MFLYIDKTENSEQHHTQNLQTYATIAMTNLLTLNT